MRRPLTWVLAASVLLIAVGVWLSGEGGAAGSALGRNSSGWLVARLYLEARGAEVELLDRPLEESAPAEGVLVLVFPLQRQLGSAELGALRGHLRGGGSLLLAYSGQRLGFPEREVFESLGVDWIEQESPSLVPWRWWRQARGGWRLDPVPGATELSRRVSIRRPELLPEPPARARVLYTAAAEEAVREAAPMVFDFPRLRGRVLVLPSDAFSNGRLLSPGNAELLESLLAGLGERWTFDEYHHGLTDPSLLEEGGAGFSWSFFLLHLALLYGLAVAALGRSFGPVWRERPAAAGSAASFLKNLGALHERMGHHGEAARLTLERAAELEGGFAAPPELGALAERVGSGEDLVELAGEVSRLQRRRTDG